METVHDPVECFKLGLDRNHEAGAPPHGHVEMGRGAPQSCGKPRFAHLERRCLARMDARLRGHSESIGQRMERDLDALLPLPEAPYDACEKQAGRVISLASAVVFGLVYVLIRRAVRLERGQGASVGMDSVLRGHTETIGQRMVPHQ